MKAVAGFHGPEEGGAPQYAGCLHPGAVSWGDPIVLADEGNNVLISLYEAGTNERIHIFRSVPNEPLVQADARQ